MIAHWLRCSAPERSVRVARALDERHPAACARARRRPPVERRARAARPPLAERGAALLLPESARRCVYVNTAQFDGIPVLQYWLAVVPARVHVVRSRAQRTLRAVRTCEWRWAHCRRCCTRCCSCSCSSQYGSTCCSAPGTGDRATHSAASRAAASSVCSRRCARCPAGQSTHAICCGAVGQSHCSSCSAVVARGRSSRALQRSK